MFVDVLSAALMTVVGIAVLAAYLVWREGDFRIDNRVAVLAIFSLSWVSGVWLAPAGFDIFGWHWSNFFVGAMLGVVFVAGLGEPLGATSRERAEAKRNSTEAKRNSTEAKRNSISWSDVLIGESVSNGVLAGLALSATVALLTFYGLASGL